MTHPDGDHKGIEEAERVEVGSLEFRTHLTEHLENARHKGTRVVITRSGKPYAALVSVADLERLEAMDPAPARGVA